MDISFNGYDANAVTFIRNGDIKVGDPVTIREPFKAEKAMPADQVIGIAAAVNGNYVTVQTRGAAEFVCESGTEVGFAKLTVSDGGKISPYGEEGPDRLIVGVTETADGTVAAIIL